MREHPQPGLDLGILRAADEADRDPRQQPCGKGADGPEHGDQRQADHEGLAALAAGGHRWEGDDHHELRQEEHRLGEDESDGVEAGLVVGQDVAGDDDVDAAEGEEGEERLAVADALPEKRHPCVLGALRARATLVSQRPQADQHGRPEADADTDEAPDLSRPPRDERATDHEPGHAGGDVERAEGGPAALALQDAGEATHDRHRHGRDRDDQRRAEMVEAEHPLDDGAQDQQDEAEGGRGAVGHAQDGVLDLGHVLRLGGDPSRGGRLQAERADTDDEHQVEGGGEGAVPLGAEQAGREDHEAVGGDVHDRHRHRDAGAAVGDALHRVSHSHAGEPSCSHRHYSRHLHNPRGAGTRRARVGQRRGRRWREHDGGCRRCGPCCSRVLMLGGALGPGYVLSYDMVWVPDLARDADVWGVGTALPRAVPSDAVVACSTRSSRGCCCRSWCCCGSLVGCRRRGRRAGGRSLARGAAGRVVADGVEPLRGRAPGDRALAGAGRVCRRCRGCCSSAGAGTSARGCPPRCRCSSCWAR